MQLKGNDMKTVKPSKIMCCLLSKQSLSKNLPNASTDRVLPSAEKNQEKQFHMVRNLALILSSVKIKSCPISILLPCGKRSQYTIEEKKSLHPSYHPQISWGLRFYLPAKGETASKERNLEALLVSFHRLQWQQPQVQFLTPEIVCTYGRWAQNFCAIG